MGEQASVSHQIGKHVQIFECIALSSGMLMNIDMPIMSAILRTLVNKQNYEHTSICAVVRMGFYTHSHLMKFMTFLDVRLKKF